MSPKRDIIDEIVEIACAQVFPYIELIDLEIHEEVDAESDLTAVIGFSGDQVRGVLGLSAGKHVIRAIYPTHLDRHSLSEEQLADWAGELANQVLGQLKLSLRRCGVSCWMAIPVVLRGVFLRVVSTYSNHVKKYRFNSPSGQLLMWLDITFEEGVKLNWIEDEQPIAGELLLF